MTRPPVKSAPGGGGRQRAQLGRDPCQVLRPSSHLASLPADFHMRPPPCPTPASHLATRPPSLRATWPRGFRRPASPAGLPPTWCGAPPRPVPLGPSLPPSALREPAFPSGQAIVRGGLIDGPDSADGSADSCGQSAEGGAANGGPRAPGSARKRLQLCRDEPSPPRSPAAAPPRAALAAVPGRKPPRAAASERPADSVCTGSSAAGGSLATAPAAPPREATDTQLRGQGWAHAAAPKAAGSRAGGARRRPMGSIAINMQTTMSDMMMGLFEPSSRSPSVF